MKIKKYLPYILFIPIFQHFNLFEADVTLTFLVIGISGGISFFWYYHDDRNVELQRLVKSAWWGGIVASIGYGISLFVVAGLAIALFQGITEQLP
ncbi:MAG: hypothetical protein ACNI26_13035 [Terasakiella sp.]|uniref:hypothetical protein n=1 Tax=unclassified Terasakiella TaxID=2614952 RepID=UPI003B00B355